MRHVLGLVLLVAALLVGAWLLVGAEPTTRALVDPPAVTRAAAPEQAPRSFGADAAERDRRLRDGARERAALADRIHEAMQARQRAPGQRLAAQGPAATPDPAAAPARPPGAPADAQQPPGAMLDRTGNHAYVTRVMTQDLMPLADECYELARQQRPDLAGMLVLDVEILGDEELGGVVDSAEPGAGNQLADPGLIECVRESLLAITLPPPEHGGRDAISMSMRFAPDPPK